MGGTERRHHPAPGRGGSDPRRLQPGPASGTPATSLDTPDDVCSYIVKRTQIYVDEAQDHRLARRAAETGTTKSDLIRHAIDAYLDEPPEEERGLEHFKRVLREVAGSIPRLPSGSQYVDELRSSDADRDDALEKHRRR